MEWKIGEIRQVNSEWYQCVKSDGTCNGCVGKFQSYSLCNEFDECVGKIFKKLEKVGKPYTDYCPSGRVIYFQRYKCYQKPAISKETIIHWADDISVSIEIKQNKEDMEEKKLNLKPFDIQKAREGKPVCTRDGRKAIFLTTLSNKNFPVVAIVCCGQEENIYQYDINGVCDEHDNNLDLMMLPEKKEGWVNVYKRENEYVCENECNVYTGIAVYKSEGEAKQNIDKNEIYINTIKITWEE